MKCEHCGSEIKENDKYCLECGHKIKQIIKPEVIPYRSSEGNVYYNFGEKPNQLSGGQAFRLYLIFFIIAAILAFIGYSYVNKDKKEIDNFNFNQININEVL